MASKLGDANALVAEGEGARKARDDAEMKLQAMGEARMRNVAAIEALDDKLAEEQLARENAEAALAAALADAAGPAAREAAAVARADAAEAQLAGLKKSLRESRVACAALDAAAGARAENRQGQAVQTDWEPIAMPLPAPPKPAGRAP
jgi:hypothetical protein